MMAITIFRIEGDGTDIVLSGGEKVDIQLGPEDGFTGTFMGVRWSAHDETYWVYIKTYLGTEIGFNLNDITGIEVIDD